MVAKEGGNKPARGILYVLSRLAIVVVVVALVIVAFYAAMNTMNIRMVAKDALSLRAEAVLMHDEEKVDSSQLGSFFTEHFLVTDSVLTGAAYAEFQITNYYQRTDINPPIVWPWQTEVTVSADDVITEIAGHKISVTDENEEADQSGEKPPEWLNGKYELSMVKAGDAWVIDDMKLVEADAPEPSETPPAEEAAGITGGAAAQPDGTESPEA